jgi:RNA polymerase sigma-70 factor (ECF subfamily)
MDDKNIISRCLLGDGQAFEMVVNKYQTPLLYFTWSILGDKDEAKDATQDAFVRSYFHLKSYDPKRSFKTWLYAIAYNRCMDRLREKQSRTRFMKKMEKEDMLTENHENPEKSWEESQQFLMLLRKLNNRERTAISLKWKEGYLSREIAEIMGCRESTVRVYILNAKRKLKNFLEKKINV